MVEKFNATSFWTGDPSFLFPGVNKGNAWYLFRGGVRFVGRCPTTADRLINFFRFLVVVPGTTRRPFLSFSTFFRLAKSKYKGGVVGDGIINGDDEGDWDDDFLVWDDVV